MSEPSLRPDGTYDLEMVDWRDTEKTWPRGGNFIIGSHTKDAVLVYQAFNREIAGYAVEHQRFKGCPGYNEKRMTWVKTNWLWMMYRCGFSKKDKNQERVLGIWLKRSAFDDILSKAAFKGGSTRIQWDPDYSPKLGKLPYRRDIQLGLSNRPTYADGTDIVRIVDVTDLALHSMESGTIPRESVYVPSDPAIAANINLTDHTKCPTGMVAGEADDDDKDAP
eukprot:TRINITY_DN187_c2_g2_i1.p1 TRINITY_DN187_c2_g2~~TRINITY_DN187_c2_g2_i1.p1  ORF type:complete len:222 (+),score=50.15 TRINITY_DN187_c2_g2_i1:301-966(+)